MAWGAIRQQAWKLQDGLCAVCSTPVSATSNVVHHRINRCQSGKETIDNAEVRHVACERAMHRDYPFGNFEGNLKGGTDVGKRSVRRGRNSRSVREHSAVVQDSCLEAVKPSVSPDLRNVAVLQCDVARSCHLDLRGLATHRLELSVNADNSIRLTVNMAV
jgi:5-methylcytosine-specific restriction endonuclease McrA